MKHGLKSQESYIFKSKKIYINLLTFKTRRSPSFSKVSKDSFEWGDGEETE